MMVGRGRQADLVRMQGKIEWVVGGERGPRLAPSAVLVGVISLSISICSKSLEGGDDLSWGFKERDIQHLSRSSGLMTMGMCVSGSFKDSLVYIPTL